MGFWLAISNGNAGRAQAGEPTIYSAWGGYGTRAAARRI
jgi:hypothetical protein